MKYFSTGIFQLFRVRGRRGWGDDRPDGRQDRSYVAWGTLNS